MKVIIRHRQTVLLAAAVICTVIYFTAVGRALASADKLVMFMIVFWGPIIGFVIVNLLDLIIPKKRKRVRRKNSSLQDVRKIKRTGSKNIKKSEIKKCKSTRMELAA